MKSRCSSNIFTSSCCVSDEASRCTADRIAWRLLLVALSCHKRESEVKSVLNDVLHDKFICEDESFRSPTLTTAIDDLLSSPSLADEYLGSQPVVIDQVAHTLLCIRNRELEEELLQMNDNCLARNPFSDINDLENYLKCCERKCDRPFIDGVYLESFLLRCFHRHSKPTSDNRSPFIFVLRTVPSTSSSFVRQRSILLLSNTITGHGWLLLSCDVFVSEFSIPVCI